MIRSVQNGRGFDVVLVLLAVGYLVTFSAFPILYNFVISFQQVDLFSLATLDREFVGLENYRTVAERPEAASVVWNTVVFVVLSIVFQLSIGFGLALFFNQDFPGASYMRGLFLAGWIMPALVVGAIWKWILAGDFGVLNYALVSLGITDGRVFWLSDPDVALYAVIIANIWLGIPFNMILLSVGLAHIPRELYEAAQLDGAGAIRRFRSVTLPMMRSTVGAVLALGIIFTLQQFDLIAGLTKGGPSNASNVAQYWSWQLSFEHYEISQGSVVSVMMILLVVAVAAIYVRSTRHENAL